MARFLHSVYSFTVRKCDKLFLALSWTLGLGSGGFAFRYVGSELVLQIPAAALCRPSAAGLFALSLLPLLFSAFAVYIGVPSLLYGVCFCKGFLFFYVSCAVMSAFGSAGWLIRWLFLFTELCSAVVLYHYCLRHISGLRRFSGRGFAGYVMLLAVIAGMDHGFISPLLRRVLS